MTKEDMIKEILANKPHETERHLKHLSCFALDAQIRMYRRMNPEWVPYATSPGEPILQSFYIRISDADSPDPLLIDQKTMDASEQGEICLNPNEFMFLCKAANQEEAVDKHRHDLMLHEWEEMHP